MKEKSQIGKFKDVVRELEEAPDEKSFDAALRKVGTALRQSAPDDNFERVEHASKRKKS